MEGQRLEAEAWLALHCKPEVTGLPGCWRGGMASGHQVLGIRIPTPGVRRGVGALEVDRIQRRSRTPTVASRLQGDRAWQGTGGPTKPRSGMAARQLGRLAETMSTGTVLNQVHPGPVDTPATRTPYPVRPQGTLCTAPHAARSAHGTRPPQRCTAFIDTLSHTLTTLLSLLIVDISDPTVLPLHSFSTHRPPRRRSPSSTAPRPLIARCNRSDAFSIRRPTPASPIHRRLGESPLIARLSRHTYTHHTPLASL